MIGDMLDYYLLVTMMQPFRNVAMLPCVCSVIDHIMKSNLVRTKKDFKVALEGQLSVSQEFETLPFSFVKKEPL